MLAFRRNSPEAQPSKFPLDVFESLGVVRVRLTFRGQEGRLDIYELAIWRFDKAGASFLRLSFDLAVKQSGV